MDIAHSSESRRDFAPVLLFSATLFTSATLMFVLQPMFAKLLLPLLGGAASVWNTCMVFYQTLLFIGYLYAHYLTTRLNHSQQIWLHTALLICSLLFIPIGITQLDTPPTERSPVFWLLAILTGSIGLPFFILSTTSPLIQKWFSHLGHEHSRDPYFLSIASNSGSLLALLSYPLIFESNLGLSDQQQYWSIGFVCLLALIMLCISFLNHSPAKQRKETKISTSKPFQPDIRQKLHWLLLSLVPSSLLIGTTNYIGTDITSVPLLWVIPLALYLLSFILVFSSLNDRLHPWVSFCQPWIVVPFLIYFFSDEKLANYSLEVILHLGIFFVCIMVCHGELAKRRPHPSYLTQYYLIMSLGGMLGGIINNFIVPFVFNDLYEYPLMIIATLLLNNFNHKQYAAVPPKAYKAALLAYLGFFLVILSKNYQHIGNDLVLALIIIAVVSNYYIFHKNLLYLFLYSSLIVSCTTSFKPSDEQTVLQSRNFYGVLSVTQTLLPTTNGLEQDILHSMYSGSTQHGAQIITNNNQCTPISYYGKQGPIGQLFHAYKQHNDHWQVGIIGLGSGALGAYGKPNQHWRFYELNPAVIDMATTTEFFSYLSECMSQYTIHAGDARLTLSQQQLPQPFDLLVIDAFTSDSIPTHLLTREALELYLSRLNNHGLLAFHISNHYLNLEPVLADHVQQLGLYGVIQKFRPDKKSLTYASDWVVLAKNKATLSPLLAYNPKNWRTLEQTPQLSQSWTDDFTSLVSVWKR
jgi:spermidine synthase